MIKFSPNAARELRDAIMSEEISYGGEDADDMMGATDCPNGCEVEPDGTCPHGYVSAGKTMGVI